MKNLVMTAQLGCLLIAAGVVLGVFATFTGPLNDGRVLAAVVLVAIGGALWLLALTEHRRRRGEAAAAREAAETARLIKLYRTHRGER